MVPGIALICVSRVSLGIFEPFPHLHDEAYVIMVNDIFLMSSWILFANILVRTFVHLSIMREIHLQFLFFNVYLCGLGIKKIVAS